MGNSFFFFFSRFFLDVFAGAMVGVTVSTEERMHAQRAGCLFFFVYQVSSMTA